MRRIAACGVGVLVLVLAGLGFGCSGVYSPPARLLPLESVALTPEGRVGVSAEIGGGGSTFGAHTLAAAGRVRGRLAERLDGSAEFGFAHFWRPDWSDEDTHPNLYVGRVGLKYRIADWLALGGGVGGGWSAGGGLFSPDLGPIVAYENPVLVPFLGLRGFISLPVDPQWVSYASGDDPMRDRPKTTYGWAVTPGLRLPLGPRAEPCASLLLGAQVMQVADADGTEFFYTGTLGSEVLF
jgi:hypothetical protein